MEGVYSPELAGPGHRENSFGETFAGFGLVAEAKLSPLHRRAQRRLRRIVRRLDSFIKHEGK